MWLRLWYGLEFIKGRMIARKGGILAGMGSLAGVRGLPTAAPPASKAALRKFIWNDQY